MYIPIYAVSTAMIELHHVVLYFVEETLSVYFQLYTIRYDKIRYINVRSKSDKMASLV